MKLALVIRHSPHESLTDSYASILKANGFELRGLNLFEAASAYDAFEPPDIDEVSCLIILGGSMSANDDRPAFHSERHYVRSAVDLGKPVFGICLGAQMLSLALGGTVEPTGGYQFGLRKIDVTSEGSTDPVFGKIKVPLVPTLHGDCFSIPAGGVKLAEGFMLCWDGGFRRINMAFRYGNSYGFQFEPQLTLDELRIWNREMSDDYKLMGSRFDPEEEATRNMREFAKYAPYYVEQMGDLLTAFLSNGGLA